MQSNLNLYYIFYEVAKAKNISAAAKELYISQPAISKAISKLESALNTSLFVRNSRGVTLTLQGEILFEQIQNAFSCIKNGEEKLKLAGDLGMGHLSIGVSTTLCKYVLLPYLKGFAKNNPHIKVSISCQSSMETIASLENNQIDIGLIGYPQLKTGLTMLPVMDIHDTFVASPAYLNNFKLRSSLSREDLVENATFMLLDKENVTRKYVDNALASSGIELQNVMEVSNMDLLIDFAKTDLGISSVIREFVIKDIENGNLKEVKILNRTSGRQIGFAYNPSKLKENPSAALFTKFVSN
jgi:DNA-binding transcriptional LysR family regulator